MMIPWELEIKLKDTEQYLKFMKKVLKLDKERNWGATEIYARDDATDPKMQGIVATVYSMNGCLLGKFAKIIREAEKEKKENQ